jgi:mono/diheme cytochrome c family protein
MVSMACLLCRALAGAALALAGAAAAAQSTPPPDRGELLYDTHCRACHTEQVHWRDKRVAVDWPRLKREVQRWQAAARLGWSDADVVAVARHLNDTVYHLPLTDDAVAALPPPASVAPGARAAR